MTRAKSLVLVFLNDVVKETSEGSAAVMAVDRMLSFINIVACSVACPGPVHPVADRAGLSCHRSKAFSAAQSRHGF